MNSIIEAPTTASVSVQEAAAARNAEDAGLARAAHPATACPAPASHPAAVPASVPATQLAPAHPAPAVATAPATPLAPVVHSDCATPSLASVSHLATATPAVQAEGLANLRMLAASSLGETPSSSTDALTGALNASGFMMAADAVMARYAREAGILAMVSLDLQGFKLYNAGCGYRSGDTLLKLVAHSLECAFPDGLVARMSDDRFAVLCHNTSVDQHLAAVHEAIAHATPHAPMQCKSGVYEIGDHDMALAAYDRATLARTLAKADYTCPIGHYRFEDWTHLSRRNYIVSRIDEAIAEGCIQVHYQPIVDAGTGQPRAFEALARWDDPVMGPLSPAEFVPALEEAHLAFKLDLCIARQVCDSLGGDLGAVYPNVPVSVNLSRTDFASCDIFAEVESIARATGTPRHLLHIEVTESALDEGSALGASVRRFRDSGYHVLMDDFGSGYSTLNVLKDHEFDTLKIDLRFLDGSDGQPSSRARAIISAVVEMARHIGMGTLAEGVETEEQRSFLQSIGCELLQGYLFGKPTPLAQLVSPAPTP